MEKITHRQILVIGAKAGDKEIENILKTLTRVSPRWKRLNDISEAEQRMINAYLAANKHVLGVNELYSFDAIKQLFKSFQ